MVAIDYDQGEGMVVVNKLIGTRTYAQDTLHGGASYNPDRARVVVSFGYTAWDADNPLNGAAGVGRRGQALYMVKVSADMNDRGTVPIFVGFSEESGTISAGSDVEITIAGGTNTRQSSLTIGAKHFLDSHGGLTAHGPAPITDVNILAGTALSATTLLVDGIEAPAIYHPIE